MRTSRRWGPVTQRFHPRLVNFQELRGARHVEPPRERQRHGGRVPANVQGMASTGKRTERESDECRGNETEFGEHPCSVGVNES